MRNRARRILLAFFMCFLSLLATLATGPLQVRAASFSSALQVPTGTNNLPIWPSVAHDSSGRIWLVYANKTIGSTVNPDIFLKTWNGLTWSNPVRVTSDNLDDDVTPFVAPLSNGSMMILWGSNRTGCNNCNRYQLFYKLYSGTTIKPSTNPIRLTFSSLNDTQPSAVQDRNGRVWVTWSRENQTTTAGGGIVFYSDIYYKYFNGTSWSKDFPLPQASNVITNGKHQTERTPSVTQTKDGRIWITWASNETADGTFDLFYKTTDGTLYTLPTSGITASSWASRINLCCSDTNADDSHPVVLQARNGTIIAFWERCVGTNCLDDIYFKTSSNNGATWTTLTAVPAASTASDERFPTATQNGDWVWLFWQTQASINTQLWYTTSDPITNVHDVGITALGASPRLIRSGIQWDPSGTTNVTVTVKNYGDFSENTTLTVRLNSTIINTTLVTNLAPNQTQTIQFTWQSPFTFWGRYTIAATLQAVPNESIVNQGDNYWSAGPVRVAPPGDLDLDGCVLIGDIATIAVAWQATPTSSNWNPLADVDHSGKVDIIDVATAASYFGDCV